MTQQMDDLEIGIGRLKKSSQEQKRIIDELKRERSFLIKKNDAIEGSIKNLQGQINPNRSDINELKNELGEAIGLITDIKARDAKFQSVLTEQKYFLGNPAFLSTVRNEVKLPLLRKDFIIDEYQVYEAKLLGADAVLLIVALLDEKKLRHLCGRS